MCPLTDIPTAEDFRKKTNLSLENLPGRKALPINESREYEWFWQNFQKKMEKESGSVPPEEAVQAKKTIFHIPNLDPMAIFFKKHADSSPMQAAISFFLEELTPYMDNYAQMGHTKTEFAFYDSSNSKDNSEFIQLLSLTMAKLGFALAYAFDPNDPEFGVRINSAGHLHGTWKLCIHW